MRRVTETAKLEALYDPWKFFDIINYHGGTQNFDTCHFEYMLVLSAFQLWEGGVFTEEHKQVWQKVTGQQLGSSGEPHSNVLLQMPRGHLKSTLNIGYILWRVWRNPNISILIATNVRDLAESFIRELRAYYEDPALQEHVWNSRPHITGNLVPALDKSMRRNSQYQDTEAEDRKILWTTAQLQVLRDIRRKEPTISTTSVGAAATGKHYDVVFMDDVVDRDNMSTETKQKRLNRWAADIASIRTKTRYLSQMGMVGGKVVRETLGDQLLVAGTHYDPKDYYVFLKKNAVPLRLAVYERNIYRNGTDPSDGYIWKRFHASTERELRAELSETPGVFEAQYLNSVINPTSVVLNMNNVTYLPEAQLLEGLHTTVLSFMNPLVGAIDYLTPMVAVDPAISTNSSADYTAICVGGKTYKDYIVALEFSVGRYTVEQTIQEVVRLITKWRCGTAYVEAMGFQDLLRRMIIKQLQESELRCGVFPFQAKGRKKHKRIEMMLQPYFSSSKVLFSREIEKMVHVTNSFTFFGKVTARDDPPDAFAMLVEHSVAPSETVRHQRSPRRQRTQNVVNLRYGGFY